MHIYTHTHTHQLQNKHQKKINLINYISSPRKMKGFCGVIPAKRRRRRMKRIPVGIIDNLDASHEGIKTVELMNRRCDFSDSSDVCVSIITWNMNGQVRYEDVRKLVGKERKYELVVIGLQEVPRTNILVLLENALLDSHVLLGKAIMQSLQLYVFGLKNSEQYIRAHGHNVEERNSELRHISQSLFSKSWNPYAKPPQVTVWLGDLNYRLQGINTFPARNLIHRNLHGLLTCKDQLLQEAERGQVFNGYYEGTLSFKPTYKYDVGSSEYDTSEKVRVPAWTDRILYKVEDKDNVDACLHLYESVDGIYSSDHKPVKAHLCLTLNES
ncbi:type IV inositol polyphosphate 5-phosphatase 11 isoform X3 [Sesamum indicum]|uniref:Type IV inositol polyphosphate 5-phosphatase 11 isoform X3 n=1 Tax=Sesamum indicum TaxID=4182 RepID=A0A8M8V512_SESIN|nr:type IV inositol polyphosphate 5-phosphatase 11 isoform X3 [Sesamum indicum]